LRDVKTKIKTPDLTRGGNSNDIAPTNTRVVLEGGRGEEKRGREGALSFPLGEGGY